MPVNAMESLSTEVDEEPSTSNQSITTRPNSREFNSRHNRNYYSQQRGFQNNYARNDHYRRYNDSNSRNKTPVYHQELNNHVDTSNSGESNCASQAGPSNQYNNGIHRGARPKYQTKNPPRQFHQQRNYYDRSRDHIPQYYNEQQDYRFFSNYIPQSNNPENRDTRKQPNIPKATKYIYVKKNYQPYYKGEPPFYLKHNIPTNLEVETEKLQISGSPSAEKSHQSKSRKVSSPRKSFYHFESFDNDETQRGMLTEQLTQNTHECMVCCEIIIREAPIWSCSSCYNIFHLPCIKKWARSPSALVQGTKNNWRCPACQYIYDKIPYQYRCFCGKVRDPEWNCCDIPHSCGEVCRKKRKDTCPHTCNLLCHPGPCPNCTSTIQKTCLCGRTTHIVRCGLSKDICCNQKCGKYLQCGLHICELVCHKNGCPTCKEEIKLKCFCGRCEKVILCGERTEEEKSGFYSCGEICGKLLLCGNHFCQNICHSGTCDECKLLPSILTHCCCGKTKIEEFIDPVPPRQSCLDPVPCCEKICDRPFACGPSDNPHTCGMRCHEGPCSPCKKTTEVICRCGLQRKQVPCVELAAYVEYSCDRRCQKKRQCGRHKCTKTCCVNSDHKCELICGRKLSCGLHNCTELCHRGTCQQCWQTSFEELTCHCGVSILYPPIPCGTRPPACKEICTRKHSCLHPVLHTCHPDPRCPPCTYLTEKMCYGNHELRRNIPCYLTEISCGRTCDKPLLCGMHHCLLVCHKGPCLKDEETCSQPCMKLREQCGHPCGSPCHLGKECPNTPCKTLVMLTCACGHQSQKVACNVTHSQYQRLTTSVLHSKMLEMQSGQSVDIRQLTALSNKNKLSRLECNEECALIERNKRLAEALSIENPEVRGKLAPPNYIDFLKDHAKLNLSFVLMVEKEFAQIIHLSSQSKQGMCSHAFPPMNRDSRRFIHELGEFYNFETYSYDQEPKRSVTVVAKRDKSSMPSMLLSTVIQREKPPKPPPPIPHASNNQITRLLTRPDNLSTEPTTPASKKSETFIDYFDMTE